ncbi:MAG: hypothetical protein WBN04_19625 [Paracoccaceae bacterium]
MNVKIEKIETAEKENLKLVAKEKSMRREFAADGIDANEQRQLDQIGGKITQLKTIVAKLRKEIEDNKRIWEGRARDHTALKSQLDDLIDWGHAQAGALKAEVTKIADAVADQSWADATAKLDQAQASMAPVYALYLTQVAAKTAYDPLRIQFDAGLAAAMAALPQTEDIAARLAQISGGIGAMDAAATALDYVTALAMLQTAHAELEVVETLIAVVQAQKAAFDTQWAMITPRLQQSAQCEFPDLTPMQDEILASQKQVEAAAASHDYISAVALITELSAKIEAYLTAYAEAVDARTLYESRLPGIQSELAGALVSEFPALAPQQAAMDKIAKAMEAAAAAGEHDQALLEMDKLVPLLDTYKIDYEKARLGQEFERLYAEMEPRFGAAAVCNYIPIEPLSVEITNDQKAAANAASAGDYADGIDILNKAAGKLDDYDARLAAIERAKADYDASLASVIARFDAIAQCEYLELDADHQAIVTLRTEMETAAGNGDYPAALTALQDLEKQIGIIETTLALLDAARNEYDIRLPAVISRLDGSMQSDYTELEDERAALAKLRAEMEAAAKATDFRLALTHMNALERMLNDLDAQLGNLINLQNQYQALYDKIKDKIAKVESCTHPELEAKKAPILVLRDAMLAAASATDFATALQKATALVGPLDEFEQLEVMLKDYTRRHEVIKPRLTEVHGYTYLSLKDDVKAIDKLYGEMTEQANKAWLKEALVKMTDLEKMVTNIIALNTELTLQEAVYKKLLDDMKGKIEIIRKNDIEEAQPAAEAVIKAYDAMVKLGDEHEFVKAVPAADGVKKLIEAYLEKVDEFGDQKEAYEILRDMALQAYGAAQQKSTEYEDLEKPFGELTKIKDAMETDASGEKYADAKIKARNLIAEIKKYDAKWVDLIKREEAIKAAADAALTRFDGLPGDADDRAEDEYKAAKSARDDLKDALSDNDFDEAEKALNKLVDALDELDDALMTTGEHKAEYEGLLGSLGPRVEKAETSDFAAVLGDQIKTASEAFAEMKETAGNEDYEGAVEKARNVEKALVEFDKAEDGLEQGKVRYDERWDGLKKQYDAACGVTDKTLKDRAGKLPGMLQSAQGLVEKKNYKDGLDELAKLRTEVESILDEAERLEDKKAKDDDDGIIERTGGKLDDITDKVLDYAKDKVIEKAKDYVGKKVGIVGETLINVGEELLDGDPLDAAVEAAKGFVKANPVVDAVETAVEIADDALDAMDAILGDDD